MRRRTHSTPKPSTLFGLLLCGLGSPTFAAPPVPYATTFTPGTTAELPYLQKIAGATALEGTRTADRGQFWVYGFAVAPGATCRLGLTLSGEPNASLPKIQVLGIKDQPQSAQVQRDADGTVSITWVAPDKWRLGARQSVLISAKDGPVTVSLVRFVQQEPDKNADGIPDTVLPLLLLGTPPRTRPEVFKAPAQPYTISQTPRQPTPALDIQTDAMFVYTTDAAAIQGWKARDYTVWTMGGSRDGKEYADKHRDEVQTTADGNPLVIGGNSFYLMPTANRLTIEQNYYRQALQNGSTGICPEEPEYFAKAGYEGAFKAAWQQRFNTPWQPPASSVDARWKASQLMSLLQTDHIAALLQDAQRQKPNVKRLVALHSPVSYAQWGIVSPHYRMTSLPAVQEVIGQVWTGTARTPARYAGVRSDRTFALAYLEYSSLVHLLRNTGKRLWFLMDPLEDDPNRSADDYKSHYEQTLIAALLFPEVDAYEVMPWPERVYERISEGYATQINSAIAALQTMHRQKEVSGNAVMEGGIGVFVSDTMQWQREAPAISDFDGFFGLTLPLLQHGIPVQVLSLDRADEPGYLRSFKTLLLTYDYQKPLNARIQAALAEWVRQGGSLLFVGGSDPYNAVSESWWRQAKLDTPQAALWERVGLPALGPATSRSTPPEDKAHYQLLIQGDGNVHDLRNRQKQTFDLSRFVRETGSAAVHFTDATPSDGWGVWVASAELKVNGKVAAAFQAGSEIEARFLAYDNGSQFNGTARFADRNGSWTYQFDNLPRNANVTLTVDVGNGFLISAASAQPDFGQTLIAAETENPLAEEYPRFRVGASYPVTFYPGVAGAKPVGASEGITPLYTLRSGETPIWRQEIGKGLLLNVGVAPGYFSSSERSAGFLRALTRLAHRHAGGNYQEARALRLQRGKYTVVATLGGAETIEGRTIDVLSPTLALAKDRVIPPYSFALLCEMENNGPGIGFVSGRVKAQVETSTLTSFYACGPAGTNGVARLQSGGKSLLKVEAWDRLGRTVKVQAYREGASLLLRYPNDPDGVIVRVRWGNSPNGG